MFSIAFLVQLPTLGMIISSLQRLELFANFHPYRQQRHALLLLHRRHYYRLHVRRLCAAN